MTMRQGKARDDEQEWRAAPRNYAPRPRAVSPAPSNWQSYLLAIAIGVALASILAQWGMQ
jgi:hypothetical protein